MAAFAEFLQRLLTDGAAVLQDRPSVNLLEQTKASAVLQQAHANVRLSVAGPLLEFDAETALAAAECGRLACWFLLVRGEESDRVESALRLSSPSRQAGQHLSADLTLRFLPQIYHRARGIAVDDVLTRGLARILRLWPLSGVLAGLDEGPTTPMETIDHPGLLLLYAERLAEQPRQTWVPRQGLAREWVERVFEERGLPLP